MRSTQVALRLAIVLVICYATIASASDIGEEIAGRVNPASYRHYLDDLLYTHDGDNRDALSGPEHQLARDNIVAAFESFGLPIEMESFTYQDTTCYNVVATQVGTVHPDAYFVIGAHYDSCLNPGADDNASGVAAMLEIARIFATYESEYTIKYIAFDTEEYWLIGSSAYVEAHVFDNIRGMISVDMIAHDLGGYSAELWAKEACTPIMTDVINAVIEYGEGLTAAISTEYTDRGDHGPFQDVGFQACMLIESAPDSNPCYHQACDSVDTPNYISYPFALSMTRSVAGYLADHARVLHPIDCATGQGCEMGIDGDEDCNGNGLWDYCDLRCGTSEDLNADGIPDECEQHETWYVDTANCPGPGSGTQADPFCLIQDGIDAASNDPSLVVEIIVADGVYTGTGNKDLDFGGKPVTVRSASGAANCVIDCQGAGRGFYFHSQESLAARVDGFTITGASTGGIYCQNSSPTIVNCTVRDNPGDAIYCTANQQGASCGPVIRNCLITGNTGDGIASWAPTFPTLCNPTVSVCTISDNTR
ncbi:MAG TPA: M28 family peptidase, partial [Phycisphaerae bacterium]|nr:M28 family peptidase [Phycisphaerae bacterium]